MSAVVLQHAAPILQELPQRHHLKELTIMHGTIGDEGVQAIAAA